jgi:bifunctional DNA-binding transcriptional regulator/antitoxin component of YhaV-PrlF toxin-antitoxin module
MLGGVVCLPLSESVTFKAVLERGGRVQVPRLLRWRYRMEPDQVLMVQVSCAEFFGSERFVGRMRKDGRLTIPRLTLKLLKGDEEGRLEGYVLEVTLEPAEEQDEKKT